MRRTALIVDDSLTARKVLQKMLEVHELAVDHASSAENALAYLSEHRPDIIFMDHEMPGMDGFEAVSAIKKNPATATIPIMMYTAQEGDLYVGQARALGAVGVLPKQVEPVELSKVLESLRVIGEDAERREHYLEADERHETGEYPALESFDHDLGTLIQELFDQQRTILRRDLRDSHEDIATRVADQIRSSGDEDARSQPQWLARLSPSFWSRTAIVLAIVAALFAWLYLQSLWTRSDIRQENENLQLALDRQQAADARDQSQANEEIDGYRQALESTYAVALDSLEWAANQSSIYAFEDEPLDDFRLSVLSELSLRLAALNFRGVVRVESHVGNFCMTLSGPGTFVLAAPDLPASQCDQIGYAPDEAYELGLRQSVAFANFINLADERTGGTIRYEIISVGNSKPLFMHPAVTESVSASEWNKIAANNHRVAVSLYPDVP